MTDPRIATAVRGTRVLAEQLARPHAARTSLAVLDALEKPVDLADLGVIERFALAERATARGVYATELLVLEALEQVAAVRETIETALIVERARA